MVVTFHLWFRQTINLRLKTNGDLFEILRKQHKGIRCNSYIYVIIFATRFRNCKTVITQIYTKQYKNALVCLYFLADVNMTSCG